jgi:hypothetical protein
MYFSAPIAISIVSENEYHFAVELLQFVNNSLNIKKLSLKFKGLKNFKITAQG